MLQQYFTAIKQSKELRDAGYRRITSDAFRLTRGDQCVLCLTFERWTGTEWVADAIPATSTRACAIKQSGSLLATTFLAYSGNSAWNRAGDWTDADPAEGKESVLLDLSAPELLALFQPGGVEITDDFLDLVFEIEETDSDGHKSTLVRAPVRIYKDVISGSEDTATGATPTKPTLDEMLNVCMAQNTAGGDFRQKDGKLQKINRTTGQWHDWGFETVDGVVTLWINQTGEA